VALPHDLSARDKESLCYSTDCLFINVICVSARFFSVTCCPVSRKWHCAACGTFCLPITLIKLQHNQHTKTVTCGMWEHEAWKHKSLCLCVCVCTWQPSAARRKVRTVGETGAAPVIISLTRPPRLACRWSYRSQFGCVYPLAENSSVFGGLNT